MGQTRGRYTSKPLTFISMFLLGILLAGCAVVPVGNTGSGIIGPIVIGQVANGTSWVGTPRFGTPTAGCIILDQPPGITPYSGLHNP